MSFSHSITLESVDGQFKVGELEALIGAAHDASSGIHQPVLVTRNRGGKVTLTVDLVEGDTEE